MPTTRYDVFRNGELHTRVFTYDDAMRYVRRGSEYVVRVYDMINNCYMRNLQ